MVINLENIYEVLKLFGLDIKDIGIERINSGHINQTVKVTADDGEYILQRINRTVFGCPEKIMSNISLVCSCSERSLEFLNCNGRNFLEYDGSVWRMYKFVPHSVSYDTLDDQSYIYEFGRILGRFHSDTKSIDINKLHVTIEDFHNTKKRIEKLLSLDKYHTCEFECLLVYAERLGAENMPIRTVHNDVKCSNVLFDKNTGSALMLIDLDTVMSGYYVYDIGDGIRSACLYNDRIDLARLKAFCRGYFSAMSDAPTAEEIFLGLVCVTAELSARYLYDAYSGENYFTDKTAEQKIIRGEQLLSLALSAADNEKKIIMAIEDCI